ncbi:hypothetical protein B0A49_05451 [Cryomyces minteri]|uniref:Uncharacterized protein n=1 Tax=Cryomyces minteri TaxID=331657 RepID=A0A4U0X4W5_9PEZI|nr:hypothetical protein B0A49_05451 [Cryomyces minteri]
MGLDATRVISSISSRAGIEPPPVEPVNPSSNLIISIVNDASYLFAREAISAAATTVAQLIHACNSFTRFVSGLSAVGLNAAIIKQVVCANEHVVTAAQGQAEIGIWSMDIFVTEIISAGIAAEYLAYMCANLHVPSMDAVGLNGTAVSIAVCNAAHGR